MAGSSPGTGAADERVVVYVGRKQAKAQRTGETLQKDTEVGLEGTHWPSEAQD